MDSWQPGFFTQGRSRSEIFKRTFMLSEEVLRNLANGEGGAYHFDLSNIQADFYEPLLKTLQTYALKKIDSLGFTCDEQARTKGWTQTPVAVLNSIACVKFHFTRNIVALLSYVLPRTASLRELTLSNMTFKKEHWERLVAGISRSTTLQRLNLSHVPIGVDGMRLLVQEMDPNQIRSVSIAHCQITEENVDDIIAFIYRKDDMIAKGGGISEFDVENSEISEAGKKKIADALYQVTAWKQMIKDAFAKEQERLAQEQFTKEELKSLQAENKQLLEELELLKARFSAVQYSDTVFVIGKGAQEFVQFIRALEEKVITYERIKRENGGRILV